MEWENIFVKYRTKIYKELYNLIDNNSTKQWTEKLNRHFFPKKSYKWPTGA